MTATTTPAKKPPTQQNIRISSILVMAFPCDGGREGGAKVAFFQPFVGVAVGQFKAKNKTQPNLVLLHSPSRKAPAKDEPGLKSMKESAHEGWC